MKADFVTFTTSVCFQGQREMSNESYFESFRNLDNICVQRHGTRPTSESVWNLEEVRLFKMAGGYEDYSDFFIIFLQRLENNYMSCTKKKKKKKKKRRTETSVFTRRLYSRAGR